jgi:hypothetical protein
MLMVASMPWPAWMYQAAFSGTAGPASRPQFQLFYVRAGVVAPADEHRLPRGDGRQGRGHDALDAGRIFRPGR